MEDIKKVSQMTIYRKEHPDYYANEKKLIAQRYMNKYNSDEEFRKKCIAYDKKRLEDPVKKEARKLYMKEYQMKKKAEKNLILSVP